jgi:hypothetical protein
MDDGGVPVRLEPPGEMNLIGYFLRCLLQRGLEAAGGRVPRSLAGQRYLIRSEGMEVTLIIGSDEIVIRRGRHPRIDASVRAGLEMMIRLLREGRIVGPVLRGSLGVRGKIWRLLPLMGVLRGGLVR